MAGLAVIVAIALMLNALTKKYCEEHGYDTSDIYPEERLAALLRDNYTCQRCRAYPVFITHHIKPRRHGGSDHRSNLMAVCSRCHPKLEP
jgi:5-methylcytosine-specific restriction endonuclease McrA